MLKSTDFLRRIISPAEGQGGVTKAYLCPRCNTFHPEDNVWWVSAGKKHCSWWCGASASQAVVFKAHAVPQGVCVCVCGNLVSALKLLANQLKDGDSPIQSIVTGLCERSRKGIMEGWRHFEEQRQSSRSEQRCMQHCSMRPAFTSWWKIGRTVMSSRRSRKKS